MASTVTIYCDGGAQPNPGPAGAGVVIVDDATGNVIDRISEFLGTKTNSEAEYTALLLGLRRAARPRVRPLEPACQRTAVPTLVGRTTRTKSMLLVESVPVRSSSHAS